MSLMPWIIKYYCRPFLYQFCICNTRKTVWAKQRIQNHGSLLSTLQAPNNWFLYPIILNKREYCLATTAEDSQAHSWKNALQTPMENNFLQHRFYLLFLPSSLISLRKLCFLLYNALGRTLTLLTNTMPEFSRNKTHFNPMFTKERDMYEFIP